MLQNRNEYYVYVYIDPRNLEEFYYGKGKGYRKYAHLYEEADSEKSQRIKEIKAEDEAKWKSNNGLFSSQLVKASLQNQPKTIHFLEQEFNIDFNELLES